MKLSQLQATVLECVRLGLRLYHQTSLLTPDPGDITREIEGCTLRRIAETTRWDLTNPWVAAIKSRAIRFISKVISKMAKLFPTDSALRR